MSSNKDKVIIFDTTLRDGEQTAGAGLTAEEKLRIARHLQAMKVDVIEAGFAASSPGDFKAIQQIAREIEGPVICSLSRAVASDIDAAAEAIKDAKRPRIHTFLSVSDIHLMHQMRKDRHSAGRRDRAPVSSDDPAHVRRVDDHAELKIHQLSW